MKIIFETFKKSIYNPSFYKSISEEPFSGIFHYYAKVTLILSFVMTLVFGIFLAPIGITFIKERAPDLIKTYYPSGLVVHIEKGEASANVPMPYIVPVKQITGNTPPLDSVQNMFVIDTNNNFEKKIFESYKTYGLLTKTEFVTQNSKGDITIQDLRGAPTTTISQEVLLGWVEKIHNSIGVIVSFGLVATFVLFIIGYIAYLVPLLIFALIPFFISWLKKTPLSYSSAYKMSLYAIVPALALKTLLNMVGILILPAYLTLLVFMLIMALNMREVKPQTLFENK